MLKNLRSFLIFILLIACIAPATGKFVVRQYTQEEGLPSSNVYSITQDKDGLIWAATFDGIANFDGIKWRKYNNNKILANSDLISYIFFDNQNIFWGVDYSSGVNFINIHNPERSIPMLKVPDFYKYSNDSTISFDNTKGNISIVVSYNQKGVWTYLNKEWKYFDLSIYSSFTRILSVTTNNGIVTIGTDNGFIIINNGKISTDINHKNGTFNTSIRSFEYDKIDPNKLWFMTDNYLAYLLNGKVVKVYNKPIFPNQEHDRKINIIPDYNNSLILHNYSSIFVLSLESKEIVKLTKKNGLLEDLCKHVFVDRENIYWFASSLGISKVPSLKFSNYYELDGLLEDEVTSLVQLSKGKYIAGHNSGISLIENFNKITKIHFSGNIQNTRVFQLVKNKRGQVIAAAKGNGLVIINDKMVIKYALPEHLGVSSVIAVAIDSNQNILYADYNSVYNFNNGYPIEIFSNPDITIKGISVSKSNKILITTQQNGVFYQSGKQFKNALAQNKSGNRTYFVYEGTSGIAWVGTDNGLYILTKSGLFKPLFLPSKLESTKIVNMIRTSDGKIWAGTDRGLLKINTSYDQGIVQYTAKDGLSGLEIHRNALIYADSSIIVGTNKGLSKHNRVFDMDRYVKPILQIKNLYVNSSKIPLVEDLTLKYDENNLRFGFNSISFYNEERNTVYYKLLPIQDTFIALDNSKINYIDFYKLAPNDYQLVLKIKNLQGIWSEEVSSPHIRIDYQFYYQSWFIFLVLIVLGIIIFLIYRYVYIRTANIELEKEAQMLEIEAQIRNAELESSEGRYRKMFYDNNAKMMLVDPDNLLIEDANPSLMEYFELLQLEIPFGRSLAELGQVLNYSREELSYLLNNEKEAELTVQFNTPSGPVLRYIRVFLTILYLDDRQITYTILNDITEEKKNQEELKELNENLEVRVQERTNELAEALETVYAEIVNRMNTEADLVKAKEDLQVSLDRQTELNKLKSQFILMVSHEYRTPLTVIYSAAELIKEFIKISQFDACVEYTGRIQQSVAMLTKLLEDAIKIGDDSNIRANKEKFNYNEYIDTILLEFQTKIKNSHNLFVDGLLDDPVIIQDRNLLKQSLNYIIDNSLKYSEKGTDIIIRNKIENSKLVIEIEDFGMGIDEYSLEKLFDPFFKAKNTIGIYSGTGLGLAITKKYVLSMNGDIFVKSEVDKGTTMIIRLPIDQY